MFKYLSATVSLGAIISGICILNRGEIYGWILPVICILGLIPFFVLVFRWNIYIFKEFAASGIKGLENPFNNLIHPLKNRKEDKVSFVLILLWIIYLVLFIVFFEILIWNSQSTENSVISSLLYFGIVPFSSFYFVFGKNINKIVQKK